MDASLPTERLAHYRTYASHCAHVVMLFCAVTVASAVPGMAQTQGPACTIAVNPPSGTAPLGVSAIGGCTPAAPATIVSESVDWGDGSAPSPVDPSSFAGFNLGHTYSGTGSFTATVTALDSAGNQGSAAQAVNVTANAPPTCTLSVSPPAGAPPLTVTANGNCTDPENDISTTVLNWGDGTTTPTASGTHMYTNTGQFTVTVTATDSGLLTGSASQTVTVNVPPTCALTVAPTSGTAPLPVSANGSCSDPENDIKNTTLNWGDGTSSSSASGTHIYPVVGTFKVVLTATDSAGGIGSASQTVVVGKGTNAPPHCSVGLSANGGNVPVPVTVTATCTDPENDISSTVISFGDGFYAAGPSATHVYARHGTFTASVTASDSAGNVSNVASGTVTIGDPVVLFAGVGNGQVKEFDSSGNLLKTLNTSQGGSTTGMGFDQVATLYVTDFSSANVTKFDGNGNLVGNFGSGYNCKPESIVFDAAGNAYVGETGCDRALLKFDAYGNLLAAYPGQTEVEGVDWIDLAPDQCTIFYTSQGKTVFRFNGCTGQQLSTFATGLQTGLGLKVLADNSVLVADKADIIRFDSGGRQVSKYTASGESCWVDVAPDRDGTSFWALDYCSSDIVHFDIASGNQLGKFNTGTASQTAFGLAMRLEPPATTPAGALMASPQSLSVTPGQSSSFTLAFAPLAAGANQTFTFSCGNLPLGASCSFTPQTATATAAGVTVHVTIGTSAAKTVAGLRAWPQRALALTLFMPGLLLIPELRRKRNARRTWIVVLCTALLMTALLLGCSASSGSSGNNGNNNSGSPLPTPGTTTPANTYPVIVHATSGSLESSTTISLAVQ